jgi:hypothetical protein
MRCVVRAALPAAVLLVTGCNLFRDPTVSVAEITSITAPDTVRVWTTFNVTVHAFLGYDMGWVLDHVEVTYTDASLDVSVWSRRNEGDFAFQRVSERNLTYEAKSAEPGDYRVIAHQPDGSTTQKTITVLP